MKNIYGIPCHTCGVYMITCKINNKVYIGKTKSDYNGYCFKYYEDYMESQSTSKSYIRRFGVENKVSDKDTRSE